jgi:hypothetical protein
MVAYSVLASKAQTGMPLIRIVGSAGASFVGRKACSFLLKWPYLAS